MSKRIDWIDAAKGILIILVVLGHSDVSLPTSIVINAFHMAAFFTLSGVTFKDDRGFFGFLSRKSRGLLLPYLLFSAVFLSYQFVLTLVFHGRTFNLWSGLQSIVFPVSGRPSTSVYGLWFLPCLFLAEIAFYWIVHLEKRSRFLSIAGYFLLTAGCVLFHRYTHVTSIISVLPIAVLFMLYGRWGNRYIALIDRNKLWFTLGAGMLFCFSTLTNYMLCRQQFDLSSMNLGVIPLYLLSGAAGAALVCVLSMWVSGSKLLKKLGRNSLYYYGLHYEIIGLVEKVLPFGGDCRPSVCSASCSLLFNF